FLVLDNVREPVADTSSDFNEWDVSATDASVAQRLYAPLMTCGQLLFGQEHLTLMRFELRCTFKTIPFAIHCYLLKEGAPTVRLSSQAIIAVRESTSPSERLYSPVDSLGCGCATRHANEEASASVT